MLSVAALLASVGVLLGGLAVWLVSVGIYLRLTRLVPGAPSVPRALGGARQVPSLTDMPADVRAYIEAESEEWARAELKALAKDLYAESGDWGATFAEMQRVAAELPAEEEY